MKRILFVGDSPDVPSGLSRIARELAQRVHSCGLASVGYAGYWGIGTKHYSFTQYALGKFDHTASAEPLLHAVQDFAPDIVFTIYDVPRLWEIAGAYRTWALWGYFPVDAEGAAPSSALTPDQKDILEAYDRVLAYGPFGARVLSTTLNRDIAWIPHAISDEWKPRLGGRDLLVRERGLRVLPEHRLLGVVATNQVRKDWGSTLQVLRELGPEWRLWGHVDKTIGVWNLPALADAYGLRDSVFLTNSLDDLSLQRLYSACDVTFAPGLGEGFGFPIVESLACGTPCVHVDYAGGADLLPTELRVPPLSYRIEGAYCLKRPVLDVGGTARAILAAVDRGDEAESLTRRADAYKWRNVWSQWKKWFMAGLK